ncbi:MAG: thioesterase family protein [Pseudomonadota bacterium]
MSKANPLHRSDFDVFRQINLRWMDVDVYGHVNNVHYLSFFDTAVNGWYIEQGVLDLDHSDKVFLVVETGCQYFREIRFGQIVNVGIRIGKLGNTSIVFDIAIFCEDFQTAAAQGKFVHVLVDRDHRRPVPIPKQMRTVFQKIAVRSD